MRPLSRIGSHLSGNLVAYLALMVALGGTSYAAVALPPNSVGTREVRNNSLLRSDLRPGQFISRVVHVAGPTVTLCAQSGPCPSPQSRFNEGFAQCPPGMQAMGGGWSVENLAEATYAD